MHPVSSPESEFHLDQSAAEPLCYSNPVYPHSFADPFVFRHAGEFYAVGTGPVPGGNRDLEFPILRSTDLVRWEPLGGSLLKRGTAARHYWAPEIAEADGIFYMYYSAGDSDEHHELRVATSSRPEGPYTEWEFPMLDPAATPFAIDPSPFRDRDGAWYLFYARNFLDDEDGYRPGTALVVAPLVDMVRVPEKFDVVMRARHDWQRFQAARPMYGGVYDWHTLEGPCVISHDGRYYCLYSGGNWQNDSYGIDFAVADSVCGPWRDTNPGEGPRVLRTAPGRVIGPGHNSALARHDGLSMIAYHAWDPAMTARRFCLDHLSWTDDGPRVAGPTWETQTLQ